MGGYKVKVVWVVLAFLACAFPGWAQSEGASTVGAGQAASGTELVEPQGAGQQAAGSITGGIVDTTGGVVAAKVRLTREGSSLDREVSAGEDGQFSFGNIAPGPFQLTLTMPGFATQIVSGTLEAGESLVVPQITLMVASAVTEVRVTPTQFEIAEEEIKEEEKQRALGFIPNFYVTYIPNAAPLSPKQKFELAWKTLVDPVTFGLTGAVAGIEQASNQFGGYGQGAQGYGKRYAAAYGDTLTGTLIGSALLPSLFKQDPRYFYKGTGTKGSRLMYAVANSVICKGDNGKWQLNYSALLGSLAAGGISNFYYPSKDRNGVGLTFENALIGIGASAAANILQEFVIKKLTTNVPGRAPAKLQSVIEKLPSFSPGGGD